MTNICVRHASGREPLSFSFRLKPFSSFPFLLLFFLPSSVNSTAPMFRSRGTCISLPFSTWQDSCGKQRQFFCLGRLSVTNSSSKPLASTLLLITFLIRSVCGSRAELPLTPLEHSLLPFQLLPCSHHPHSSREIIIVNLFHRIPLDLKSFEERWVVACTNAPGTNCLN